MLEKNVKQQKGTTNKLQDKIIEYSQRFSDIEKAMLNINEQNDEKILNLNQRINDIASQCDNFLTKDQNDVKLQNINTNTGIQI